MDNDSDNIIHLLQPAPDAEAKKLLNVVISERKNNEQNLCRHARTTVSEINRTLTCSLCGAVLDPFEFILDRARNAENIVHEINRLHKKREALRESVAGLEREEKNAKARLRSARTAILFAENDLKNIELEKKYNG
ncbi:hypothetical protein IM098_003666 [Escherichia coli]|uniref:hypothetical protein n=1 Tax=Escherichia coli TaxID=562 RepID=UPI0003BE026D|nr:hypothetical protein [Escherichia coli]EEZ9716347.1 hypothetical protein [Escherichia coli]EFD7699303.1 hypothetical protein [Escherichia coli]EFD7709032.1 hypothetical protein [Escherichia coli]EFD9268802.1 hypothetical protein [Escherichia coli]EFE1252432.1 hypothetical protein [Escherichia coli]